MGGPRNTYEWKQEIRAIFGLESIKGGHLRRLYAGERVILQLKIKETGCENVKWIEPAQNSDECSGATEP
jgi:hypothetical protein